MTTSFSVSFSTSSPNTSLDHINSARAFVDVHRRPEPYRNPMERIHDWDEINPISTENSLIDRRVQAARCMDCGTPFCQTHTGCPINNLIPEWNELVYRGEWKEAIHRLHKTNNFPEFTGRVCPAPCEGACVAGLVESPITIKNIEYAIIDKAWEEGWVSPRIPSKRLGATVAVIGSGPAGLACADQLNQMGYHVIVYEREDRIGGLLMYGIPNMKLEKQTVERRIALLEEEGIEFRTNAHVGKNLTMEEIKSEAHAIVLCVGSTIPRDLDLPKRHELKGIHFAMEFLTKNQKRLLLTKEGKLESGWDRDFVTAEGKNVIVIGGGDTGTDCIGTSMRHRCQSIVNFEINACPPTVRNEETNPWPEYPRVFGVDYGHAEVKAVFGHDPRTYKVLTKAFVGDEKGHVKGLITKEVDFVNGQLIEIEGTEKEWKCDLVILAMGFIQAEDAVLKEMSLTLEDGVIPTLKENEAMQLYAYEDEENWKQVEKLKKALKEDLTPLQKRQKRLEDRYYTEEEGVFAAGDCRRGQSLVVWAIREGRGAAEAVHSYFKKRGDIETNTRVY